MIDDERGPRESMRFLLKEEFDIHCLNSVDKGIAFLKANPADMVILDIRMPGKSGIDALKEIREIDTDVSVIILTGYGALETAQQAIRLGANDYLQKPFEISEMLDCVRRYTRRTQLARRRTHVAANLSELNARLNQELAHKERMAAMGRASAEFVHDLRNPLTIVTGYTALLQKELEEAKGLVDTELDKAADYLKVIERNLDRCRDLSASWREFGSDRAPQQEALTLGSLMEEVVASVIPLAEHDAVTLNMHLHDKEATVYGCLPDLLRALHNLLANAIQAAPPHTGIIEISSQPNDSFIEIHISDNGCGMNPQQLNQAFEAYYTTKGENGTGLGLPIAQRIITEHQGQLKLESKSGKGTIACVNLPVPEPEHQ